MKPEILIRAGAILLPKAKLPKDILSDEVVARQWSHPALEAPVVRLPTQNMLRGIDLEMGLLGFSEPDEKGIVGKTRRAKLGFPGWALVNDPDHARFALDVVKDLKKAVRKIKSKPGTAKDLINEIAGRLSASVPHFLPSFYEEAARSFIAFENYTYASQYFEKARESERVYALKVDPEMREQTFVDFALARALSVKSLTNFGLEMIEKGKAKEGFESYFRIAVRRTRGGLPPSPAMAKDLKRLAKAAKLDPAEEERNFLRELLGAAALRMAPAGFWKAYNKSLKALAKEDPAARSGMLDLFPNMHPRQWFEVLDACNACKALYDDSVEKESKSKHTTADWFGLVLKQQNNCGWRGAKDVADRILTLLVECGPRLVEDGIAIPLPEGWHGANPDVIETGLSMGATFKVPENASMLSLNDVVEYKDNPLKCLDWEWISKNETFRPMAIRAIWNGSGYMHSWIELLETRPFIRDVVDEWLTDSVAKISETGGVIDSYDAVTRFANYPKQLWNFYPKQAETLMATDIAIPLRNTLQIGIWDEYGWPVYEEALAKFPKVEEVRLAGNFPYLCIFDKVNARVIGGEGIVLEAEIPSHAEAEIESMIYTQNTLLLIYKKGWQEYGQWLGTPKLFSIDNRLEYRRSCLRLPDGRAMFDGRRIITPGDQSFSYDYERSGHVSSDGKNFWNVENNPIDPVTGKTIDGPKRPFVVNEAGHFGWIKHVPNASDKSPVSVKDDLMGMRWTADSDRRIIGREDIGGVKYDGTHSVTHLFKFVGDDEPRLFDEKWRGFELSSAEGVLSVTSHARFRHGGFPRLSEYLAYFEPRDEKASVALRKISLEKCTEFLKDASEGEEGLLKKLVSSFTDLKDEGFRKGLAGMILLAADQRKKLDDLKKGVEKSVSTTAVKPYEKDPKNMGKAFEGLVNVGTRDHIFLAQIKEISTYFSRENPQESDGFSAREGSGMWEDAIGYLGAFAFRAALPDSILENAADNVALRETIKSLLYTLAEGPYVGSDLSEKLRYFVFARKKDEKDEYITHDFRCVPSVDPEDEALILSRGVAMTSYQGNDFFTWGSYHSHVGFEFARSGKFSDIDVKLVDSFESGWGTTEDLDQFFALFEKHGPLPIGDAIPIFMDLTALTEPEASLAISDWQSSRFLKMKAGTLSWASDVFQSPILPAKAFFNEIVISGPLEDLWNSEKLAHRAAKAWLGSDTKGVPVDVEFMEAFKKSFKNSQTFGVRTITNLEKAQTFNPVSKGVWKDGYQQSGSVNIAYYMQILTFAMHNARVGSQVYKNIGPVLERIRKQYSEPDHLFRIAYMWDSERGDELSSLLKGKPSTDPNNKETVVGSKGVFATKSGNRSIFWANWKALQEGHPLIDKLRLNGLDNNVAMIEILFGPDVDRMIERSKDSKVPTGEFETNPIFSVPEVVGAMAKKYKMSEDAAVLYLQVAALPFPSDANIRYWNGWKKKQHDNAIDELVKKKLVVSAKRARASRSIFVHGHWEPKAWEKPMESWKFKHLEWCDDEGNYTYRNLSNCILQTPDVLFSRVWERIKSGDAPAFEEVK